MLCLLYMKGLEHTPAMKSSHEKLLFRKDEDVTKSYDVDGRLVQVQTKEFVPMHEIPKDKALLFLTGWSAGDAKTLEHLTGRFAADSGEKALQVRTSSEGVRSTALAEEARAIQKLIQE